MSWLKVLKSDKRAIFNASSSAEKAAKLILQNSEFAHKDNEEDEKEAA